MNTLGNKMIFISHTWEYSSHYWILIDWFQKEAGFSCRVPDHNAFPDNGPEHLKEKLTGQMRPAQAVVVLGGLYYTHKDWIDYTISEARRMNKPIIGVRSWKHGWVPPDVQKASAVPVVSWNRSSVVQAVREVLSGSGLPKVQGSADSAGKETVMRKWHFPGFPIDRTLS